METVGLNTSEYWENPEPDVRFNPVGSATQPGVIDFVRASPELAGHVLVATSGSAGEPKWIALSKMALLASARAVNAHLEAGKSDRWLAALPTFHVGGLGVFARAFLAGIPVIRFPERWRGRVAEFASVCDSEKVTLTSLTPTQVHDLVTAGIPGSKSLRAVVVGGGRLDPETGSAARALGWPVLASYGMTEAGSQVATELIKALREPFGGEWLPVLPHWEVTTGPEGRLKIRGAALFSGSVESMASGGWRWVPALVDGDGWFETTDRGEIRSGTGGRAEIRFEGRFDNLVKKLGELVSLETVDRVIASETTVRGIDAVVVAVPDSRLDHRLVAVFEGIDPGDPRAAECVVAANRQLPAFSRIDEIRHLPEWPRTALGKVSKNRLVDLLQQSSPGR